MAKWQELHRPPETTRYISMSSDPDDLRGMQTPVYKFFHTSTKKASLAEQGIR